MLERFSRRHFLMSAAAIALCSALLCAFSAYLCVLAVKEISDQLNR